MPDSWRKFAANGKKSSIYKDLGQSVPGEANYRQLQRDWEESNNWIILDTH